MNGKNNSESPAVPQEGKRPNGITQRTNNSTRLVALRRRCSDVEAILHRVPARRGDAEVQRVVTLLSAEIAILADPAAPERTFWSESAAFLARALGHDAALDLWTRYAEKPIAAHLARVAQAREDLARDHEARVRAEKLITDNALSTALGFTFGHRTDWFGGKSALVPVAESPRDKELSARLREIAKLNGLRPERVRDAFRAGGMAGVETLLAKVKAQPAPKWEGRPKRGRPLKGEERVADRVAKLIEQTGRSRSLILDVYAAVRKHHPDADDRLQWAYVLRSLRANSNRHRHTRHGRNAVIAHYAHTHGKPPSNQQISNWIKSGTYAGRVREAETWIATDAIAARPSQGSARVAADSLHIFRETPDSGSARPVRAAEADSDARAEKTDEDAQGASLRG